MSNPSESSKQFEMKSSSLLLWLIVLTISIFIAWAAFAVLDEVAIGEGRVTPASKGQIIQSRDGGILVALPIREGDIIEQGQEIASLDPVMARAMMEEGLAQITALKARAARLFAEMSELSDITFPADIAGNAEVVQRETELFKANRSALEETVANLQNQLSLADRELTITEPLLRSGATNEVEVLRLRQKVAEIASKIDATRSEYNVALKADYSKVMGELEPLLKNQEARTDQLSRTIIRSPTRGIVKDIQVSTIGGVVAPGGILMEVVPLEDQLLIEAKINPRDIAFIRPGQEAVVKITAYDSSIYGTMSAKVDRVSPDTIEDQIDKRLYYYRVYVLTDKAYLETKDGKHHPIMPGMVATTEIRTGSNTVLGYLLKPLRRASEALRER